MNKILALREKRANLWNETKPRLSWTAIAVRTA